MGLEVTREHFTDDDSTRFAARLQESLVALESVLARPGFGAGPPTIGAELELSLVDGDMRPLPRNRDVLAEARHPLLTLETDRFNVECQTTPVPLAGRPFSALGAELASLLGTVADAAARHGGRPVLVGILPTLGRDDVQATALTEAPRYRALSAALRRQRAAPFELAIDGEDALRIACDDVTFEGAATSWQVHLRVPPGDFARTYNAAQMAIGPALAVAGNSPILLGHRLWEETRVALFRQAVDERTGPSDGEDWRPARVSFGHGWVRRGPLELFRESVALHAPLIPFVDDREAPLAAARTGVPSLRELRLHQSTIWRWTRAVYDPAGGGHVRIEMRAFPAGPTVPDMLANAAFLLGLTLALAPDADRLVTALTFGQARWNFYAAARHGLDANLLWPVSVPPSPEMTPAPALVRALLPVARDGLAANGVDAAEAEATLAPIAGRLASGRTGARWQRRALAALGRRHGRDEALRRLLARYLALSATGTPVHAWPDQA
jgi:gamma-glutamyl:cysteine ligase YbdK (ATP-grasp superfamily)